LQAGGVRRTLPVSADHVVAMRSRRLLHLALALPLLAGCDALLPLPETSPLLGPWELTHPSFPGGQPRTISFEGQGAHGTAGCNYYGAGVRGGGGQSGALRIGVAGMTRMWCDGVMPHEARYIDLLESVRSFEVRGDALVLSGAAVPLRFRRP
jgi:hypothetical protein